jgi:hypothetical protein
MKPEYFKEIEVPYYYKVLGRKGENLKVLEVSSSAIELGYYPESWVKDTAKSCTEAVFVKRYNQTLKKIERAVAK